MRALPARLVFLSVTISFTAASDLVAQPLVITGATVIDATGRAGDAGKDVGQDLKKTTFVSFSGTEGARQLAGELIQASQDALQGFGPRGRPLQELARYVFVRKR